MVDVEFLADGKDVFLVVVLDAYDGAVTQCDGARVDFLFGRVGRYAEGVREVLQLLDAVFEVVGDVRGGRAV